MKKSDLLLLGGAGLVAYLLFKKSGAAGASDFLGGLGGGFNDLVGGAEQLAGQLENRAAQTYAGGVGAVLAPVGFGAVGASTPAQTQSFSDLFNTFVGGGTQLTQVNAAGNAINLNPGLQGMGGSVFSGPAQIVQGALTAGAINAGIGFMSLTPQAGGGIATNYGAIGQARAPVSSSTQSGSASNNKASSSTSSKSQSSAPMSKAPVMQSKVPVFMSYINKK